MFYFFPLTIALYGICLILFYIPRHFLDNFWFMSILFSYFSEMHFFPQQMMVLVLVVGGREVGMFYFSFISEESLIFTFYFLFPFTVTFQRSPPLLYLSLFLPEVLFPLLSLLVLFIFKPLSSIRCFVQPSLRPVFSILTLTLDFLFLGLISFVFCLSSPLSSLFYGVS